MGEGWVGTWLTGVEGMVLSAVRSRQLSKKKISDSKLLRVMPGMSMMKKMKKTPLFFPI